MSAKEIVVRRKEKGNFMKHPIYIEYYSHENEDCYKIDLPWSEYRSDTKVLCKVSEGYEYARLIAIGVISKYFVEITKDAPESLEEAQTQQPTAAASHA